MPTYVIDELKMAVDSFFSFLNLRKQQTNPKLKLLFKIKTQTNQPSKIAPLTLLLNGYTSQPQVHKLGLTAYETNTLKSSTFRILE